MRLGRFVGSDSAFLSSDLNRQLREWDKGSRQVRLKILEAFISKNRNRTGPQLEQEYGNGASLFLARITTWLRLTYLLGSSMSLQLEAIGVFVGASSGHRFVTEFLDLGGLNTILDIIALDRTSQEDKRQTLLVLHAIANGGRFYKELICDTQGVQVVAACMVATRDDATLQHASNLMVNLARGNARYARSVQAGLVRVLTCSSSGPQRIAAQALRILLSPQTAAAATPAPGGGRGGVLQPDANMVDSTMLMLRSVNFQVQYEALELLRLLVSFPALQDTVLNALVAALRPNVAAFDQAQYTTESTDLPFSDHKSSLYKGGQGAAAGATNHMHPLYIAQACAAKILGTLASISPTWADAIVSKRVIPGLLVSLANNHNVDSQKQAALTLFSLCTMLPRAAAITRNLIGHDLYDIFLRRPESMYRDVSQHVIDLLFRAVADADAALTNPELNTQPEPRLSPPAPASPPTVPSSGHTATARGSPDSKPPHAANPASPSPPSLPSQPASTLPIAVPLAPSDLRAAATHAARGAALSPLPDESEAPLHTALPAATHDVRNTATRHLEHQMGEMVQSPEELKVNSNVNLVQLDEHPPPHLDDPPLP